MIKYLAGILLALCLSSAFAQHVDLQKKHATSELDHVRAMQGLRELHQPIQQARH